MKQLLIAGTQFFKLLTIVMMILCAVVGGVLLFGDFPVLVLCFVLLGAVIFYGCYSDARRRA